MEGYGHVRISCEIEDSYNLQEFIYKQYPFLP